jgi:uncharacterized protein (TIGR03083 family)
MSTTSTAREGIDLTEDAALVLSSTRAAARRLARDLQAVDPGVWARPACGEWTVDQTVGHLVLGPVAYLEIIDQIVAGTDHVLFDVTDADFAEAQLEMMGEATPDERIDSLVSGFDLFIDSAATIPAEALAGTTWTPEAVDMPVVAALAIGLNELIVHGFEIREAAGVPTEPDLPETRAIRAFAIHALAGLVRGDVPPIELRVEGGEPVTLWASEDGSVFGAGESDLVASVTCSPAVLALLSWGRLDFEEASRRGWATISGDHDAVRQLAAAVHPF